MGTIMVLYIVVFSCFFYRVTEVFTQVFIIYIFSFFSLNFLKISFILCDVQVIKG
jgi:hypothetical protein